MKLFCSKCSKLSSNVVSKKVFAVLSAIAVIAMGAAAVHFVKSTPQGGSVDESTALVHPVFVTRQASDDELRIDTALLPMVVEIPKPAEVVYKTEPVKVATVPVKVASKPPEPKVKIASQPTQAKAYATLNQIAANPQRYSSDAKIIAALNVLKENGATEIFENLDMMNAEIKLYDFENLGYEYRKHYALNTKKNGKAVIAINSRYSDSPAEAIASLIAHESFHKLGTATLDEEVFCTMMEAKYWRMLKVSGKRYNDEDVLVFKLDNWATMYMAITKDNNPIRTKIANSAFYKERLA